MQAQAQGMQGTVAQVPRTPLSPSTFLYRNGYRMYRDSTTVEVSSSASYDAVTALEFGHGNWHMRDAARVHHLRYGNPHVDASGVGDGTQSLCIGSCGCFDHIDRSCLCAVPLLCTSGGRGSHSSRSVDGGMHALDLTPCACGCLVTSWIHAVIWLLCIVCIGVLSLAGSVQACLHVDLKRLALAAGRKSILDLGVEGTVPNATDAIREVAILCGESDYSRDSEARVL